MSLEFQTFSRIISIQEFKFNNFLLSSIIVGGVQKVESTANQTGASNVEDGARDIRKSIEQEKPVGYVASARIVVGAIIDRPMEIVQK